MEQKGKIWCKNIHAFLRNCDFRVGAFYFDAPCRSAFSNDDTQHDVHMSLQMTRRKNEGLMDVIAITPTYIHAVSLARVELRVQTKARVE